MTTDPISDFLTRIRNAQRAHLDSIDIPSSRMKFAIAKIFEREGYIRSAAEQSDGPRKVLTLALKYEGKQPAIRSVSRVSTPGRRVYRKAADLPRVLSDQGIAVVSTSMGVMTNKEARKRRLGGEVLCEIT